MLEVFDPIRRAASADALAKVPLEDGRRAFVERRNGRRPERAEASDPRLVQAADTLSRADAVAEAEADVRATELAAPPAAISLGLIILGLFALETFGAYDLVEQSLDVPGQTAIVLGLALAAFVFGATAATAEELGRARARPPGQRSRRTVAVVLGYGLLVCAAVTARFLALGDADGATPAGNVASSILIAAAVIGPAWLAKSLLPKWLEARQLHQQLRQARARLRQQQSQVNSAQLLLTGNDDAPARWDTATTQDAAAYTTFYRRALAEHGINPQ